MKILRRFAVAIAVSLALSGGAIADGPTPAGAPATARERLAMNTGWGFAFGHPSDPSKDFDHATGYFSYFAKAGYADGPAAAKFDDRAWRRLDLPHDWAVEAPFDAKASSSHGYKAIGRAFPERSVGWYRKTFNIPSSDLGRRICIELDGVFRDSVVWINGFHLGRQPSGYTSFQYDLTDYLNYGGENVIAVRVDATMEEGWFYEGAGLYRSVWLTKTSPLHVAHWGTFVSTQLKNDAADITANTTVVNEGTADATFDLEQSIVDASGSVIANGIVRSARLAPGATTELACALSVPHPRLWTIETPVLHRLVTTIRSGGAAVDQYETPFGIRTVRLDPDRGFFLNGQHVEIKGVNLHQDHAGVGVALPDALESFRIARLKEFGCNALRSAHNPPSPELLDAADRLGFLVLDENRLMGTNAEQLGQLESLMKRDRNHPSVFLWSIGNEEWSIEGNIKGARIAATMQAFAHRLDPTRQVTAAVSGGWGGISTTIEVAGYNYIKQSNSDKQHADYPAQPGIGTEESTTRQTRGIYFDDPARGHTAPRLDASSGGNMELGWQHYVARPYLAGVFFWTGFDYRGEPDPYTWPEVNSQSGILDLCGFPKDGTYYLKAWWGDKPVVHVFPHWNWPGREGQKINVWCYSNCDEIELLLNGHSLGAKLMPRNGHLEWDVSYEPGTLEARGTREGRVIATDRVETTGKTAALAIAPDRGTVAADGRDVVVFTVAALDLQGRRVPTADNLAKFSVSGGRIIGVGNGDPASHEPELFLAGHEVVAVEDWRGRIAPSNTSAPSTLNLPPLPQLGRWRAPLPEHGEVYELASSFSPGFVAPGSGLELFLPALGAKTSVWLNGHALVRDSDTTKAMASLHLDPALLTAGINRLQLIVTPIADGQNHIPELTRLGAVTVSTPAPQAQRSLFNGLAQVIVQTTREPGAIVLTASTEGFPEVTCTVVAQPAPFGSFIP